jgi:hypothetical protein
VVLYFVDFALFDLVCVGDDPLQEDSYNRAIVGIRYTDLVRYLRGGGDTEQQLDRPKAFNNHVMLLHTTLHYYINT